MDGWGGEGFQGGYLLSVDHSWDRGCRCCVFVAVYSLTGQSNGGNASRSIEPSSASNISTLPAGGDQWSSTLCPGGAVSSWGVLTVACGLCLDGSFTRPRRGTSASDEYRDGMCELSYYQQAKRRDRKGEQRKQLARR